MVKDKEGEMTHQTEEMPEEKSKYCTRGRFLVQLLWPYFIRDEMKRKAAMITDSCRHVVVVIEEDCVGCFIFLQIVPFCNIRMI